MPIQMETTKNLYEHKILLQMMEPEFDEADCKRTIEEYMNLRYQHCMLNKHFSEGVKSDNGHIFMKMLREEVIGELNLLNEPEASELHY